MTITPRTDLYREAFEKLAASGCSLAEVRAIEGGASSTMLWQSLSNSGFLDLFTPEAHGGSGLTLQQAYPLLCAAGAAPMPLPVVPTMLARAFLTDAGITTPAGPITLSLGKVGRQGGVSCHRVPWGMVSDWVLTDIGGMCVLLPTDEASRTSAGTPGSQSADMRWANISPDVVRVLEEVDLQFLIAAILAAHMVGAMDQILTATIRFAMDRKQFGKPIGRFQAIQQQISVMAEQAHAAGMAAEMGCNGRGARAYLPQPLAAATAKARCSEAASGIASIAHAVHGAIGVTQQCDLQLFTRRLQEWRLAGGSEGYWHGYIGNALWRQDGSTLDFIRHIGSDRGSAMS